MTASVRSSIFEYNYENGRRYHAYKEGAYFMPNDEPEQERMNMQHTAQYLALRHRSYLAPIGDNPERILDLGTGTGIWAVEMGDRFPNAQIIGVDLSPIQTVWVPPNVKFEVDDIEEEWTFRENHFDFIFSKVMFAGSIADPRKYIQQAFRHCRPGGHFEMQELITRICSDHYEIPEDSSIQRWCQLMVEGIRVMGRRLDMPFEEMVDLMQEAGFEDVTIKPFRVPIGQWPADPVLKQAGRLQLLAMLEGIESLSLAVFTRCLHWEREEVEVFLAQVRTEFGRRRSCFYWPA
jgi:ubiquinone/menaquinone biosynthesis C-methylase UbiE